MEAIEVRPLTDREAGWFQPIKEALEASGWSAKEIGLWPFTPNQDFFLHPGEAPIAPIDEFGRMRPSTVIRRRLEMSMARRTALWIAWRGKYQRRSQASFEDWATSPYDEWAGDVPFARAMRETLEAVHSYMST